MEQIIVNLGYLLVFGLFVYFCIWPTIKKKLGDWWFDRFDK